MGTFSLCVLDRLKTIREMQNRLIMDNLVVAGVKFNTISVLQMCIFQKRNLTLLVRRLKVTIWKYPVPHVSWKETDSLSRFSSFSERVDPLSSLSRE